MSLVEKIKKKHGNSTLLVDAGNVLFKTAPNAARENDFTIAKGIIAGYQLIGYDAVGVSPLDLLGGEKFFSSVDASKIHWVTANVTPENGSVNFPPYLTKKVDNLTVGVIGLTGIPDKKIAHFSVQDWREALDETLPKMATECDLIILLSSLSAKDNEELVKQYPQINILFTADKRRGNISPRVVNKTLLAQVAGRGKYLGQLDVRWDGTSDWQNQSTFKSRSHKVHPKSRVKEMDIIIQEIEKQLKK